MAADESGVLKGIQQQFNMNGFGFPYAILKICEDAANDRESPWTKHTPEFPIQLEGKDTRIDLILSHTARSAYLILECKRANPSLANWVFFKDPFHHTYHDLAKRAFCEAVWTNQNELTRAKLNIIQSSDVYSIYFESRTDKSGDPVGNNRNSIEDAATQVCRGFNGFVKLFEANPDRLRTMNGEKMLFFPVVVTTANLFGSERDLRETDPATGNLKLAHEDLCPKKWIYLHYNQTPSLVGKLPQFTQRDLRDYLYTEFVTTIAVVNSNHMGEFLGKDFWGS